MARWLIWGIVVVAMTVALEIPAPPPEIPGGELLSGNRLLISKSVHILGYGLLTLSASWLPLAGGYRICLLFFLMAHATVTEMFQVLLEKYCHRTGSLWDVGIDQLAILLGMALSWRWWTSHDSKATNLTTGAKLYEPEASATD